MSSRVTQGLEYLWSLPKSLLFNLRYLPLRQALRLPVLIHPRVRLKRCGGRIIVPPKARTGGIRIGFGDVEIFDRTRSSTLWKVEGVVEFQGKAKLGHGSKLIVKGHLTLGAGFNISAESTIVCYREIRFGEGCLLSWDSLIMDTDYHRLTGEQGEQLNPPQPISIGDRVWIGCRCLILKGTIVDSGSVIAAGSLLSKRYEGEQQLLGGAPARVLRSRVNWEH